jgi:hypothetical protein
MFFEVHVSSLPPHIRSFTPDVWVTDFVVEYTTKKRNRNRDVEMKTRKYRSPFWEATALFIFRGTRRLITKKKN